MKKDRCEKYKNKKTFNRPKNQVYNKCKRCPLHKTFETTGHINCLDITPDEWKKKKKKDKLKNPIFYSKKTRKKRS